MGEFEGLQILPEKKKKVTLKSLYGGSFLFGAAILFLIIIGIVYWVLLFMTNSAKARIDEIDVQLFAINKDRNLAEEEKLTDFNSQVEDIRKILASHIIWSKSFKDLQKYTDPRVSVLTFSGDSVRRTISINAIADNFTSVSRQISSLYSNEAISELKVNKIAIGENGRVEFSMDLIFKPEYFISSKEK